MSDRKRLVLHVDDDPQMLRIVAALLRKQNYEVISLEDPREAKAALLGSDCRVVISDVDMPHLNGLDLLRQIKQQDGGIHVVMLTGLVSMTTILESMRLGAEACVFKPIDDPTELLETLDTTFVKVERWWNALRDLNARRRRETEEMTGSV